MKAFSKPSGGIVSHDESGGDKGEVCSGLAGQNQSGRLAASIAPAKGAWIQPTCSSGGSGAGHDLSSTCDTSRGGTEWCLESTGGATTHTASSSCHSNRCDWGTELSQEYGARGNPDLVCIGLSGGLAAPNERLLTTEGVGEGAIEEMEDNDIAAADWLDVTHALLDGVNESHQACRR